MRAFEIHTFTGGKWKIDSVFDDRELAMFEAQRIDESNRYAGVRVVEENFDEKTQMSTAKTIFRGGRVEADVTRASSPPLQSRARARGAERGGRGAQRAGRQAAGRAQKAPKSNAALMTMLVVIVIAGIAAMVTLHILPRFV